MPLDALQRDIVALLRANRSPDLDIYVEDAPLAEIAATDVRKLREAGLSVAVENIYGLVIEATVSRAAEQTLVEWNEADRQRFFPSGTAP